MNAWDIILIRPAAAAIIYTVMATQNRSRYKNDNGRTRP